MMGARRKRVRRFGQDGRYRGVSVYWCPDCEGLHFEAAGYEWLFFDAEEVFDAVDVFVEHGAVAFRARYGPHFH